MYSGIEASGPPDLRTDSDLLTEVFAGEAEAFGQLYLRHARAVFSFCGRRSGDWSRAEDLCSEVFLQAWRSRERAVLVEESLRPWLLGVASNVVSVSARSHRRYGSALLRLAGMREASQPAPDDVAEQATSSADRDDTARQVWRAMDRLSPAHRQVVELCLMGGLSATAAATVLGLPVSTVQSRLEDGRARLRRLLRSGDVDRPSWLIGHLQGVRHERAAAADTEGQARDD